MADIWMRTECVPNEEFFSLIVVPFLSALGKHGVRANLEPMEDRIYQNQGILSYALFPGGELIFAFTTGPTYNTISDSVDEERYMMASVEHIPHGFGITNESVDEAIGDFRTGLYEREIFPGSVRITSGGSVGGKAKIESSSGPATSDAIAPSAQTKSGCYVATAVYGGYDLPQVRVLRRFRDELLSRSFAGRCFITFYYWMSPWLVDRVGSRRWFTGLARPLLDRITMGLSSAGFPDSPFDDPR